MDLSAVATLAGVTKKLGGKPVLNRLDLAIRAGEVAALIGPNGAGKSTSVGLLTGRLTPMQVRRSCSGSIRAVPPRAGAWA